MTTPLGEIGKPEAEGFKKGRKLYLVPMFSFGPDVPAELREKVTSYWSGAQEHISRLEAPLGRVDRVYHETVFMPGEEGAKLVEVLNPAGYSLVQSRIEAGAQLEATEDRAQVEESSDWQRCISAGLVSEKASSTVFQSYLEVTNQRYQYIAARIDETLNEDESAILIIGDNHRVQFPGDIQVFYIAPPALNDLRRWISDRMRQGPVSDGGAEGADDAAETEEGEEILN